MDDLISRQAVLKIIDGWYEQNRDTDNIEDLIVLITYMDSVNPQKPICPSAGIDCEDCPAYEKTLNKWIGAEVLDRIRNEMHATAEKHEDGVYYLRDEWIDVIIDKYAEEGKA